jgi:hypothetical protein
MAKMQAIRLDQIPELEPDHVLAMRAVVRGHATPAQQKTFVWIVLNHLCGMTAFPVASWSEREGGFQDGKQWIAMAISYLAGIGIYEVRDEDGNAASTGAGLEGSKPEEG